MSASYELFYWPNMPGRGEFVRLMFVFTQTPFCDVSNEAEKEGGALVFRKMTELRSSGRGYAPPILVVHRADGSVLELTQTPVILRYLAETLADGILCPNTEEDRWQAEVLLHGITGLVDVAHDLYHPLHPNVSFHEQKGPELDRTMALFKELYLPRWTTYFETVLKSNGTGFAVGNKMTYVDIALQFLCQGIAFQCPEEWKAFDVPALKEHEKMVSSIPVMAEYLSSDKRLPFDGTGVCM